MKAFSLRVFYDNVIRNKVKRMSFNKCNTKLAETSVPNESKKELVYFFPLPNTFVL